MTVKLSFDLGKNTVKKGSNVIRCNDGANVFKILQPFGAKADGALFAFWGIHFVTNASGAKSPVPCTYYTEKYCPICAKNKELREQADALKAKGLDVPKELNDQIFQTSASRGYYYNVIKADGTIAVLQIGKKAHEQLLGKIHQAVDEFELDPIDYKDGVWFNITKTGKGLNTEYAVDFKKSYDKESKAEKLYTAPIEDDVISTLDTQMTDLFELFTVVSAKELANKFNAVPEDDGPEPEVDEVTPTEVAEAEDAEPAAAAQSAQSEAEELDSFFNN